MQSDSLLSPSRDVIEDCGMDSIRTHKRFLSEASPACLLCAQALRKQPSQALGCST